MTGPSSERTADAEALARLFHETYERFAPEYGYKPREETSVPWDDVPDPNRSLMVAVAGEVQDALVARNQQLQEALAAYERMRFDARASLNRYFSDPDEKWLMDTLSTLDGLDPDYVAALASVRARSET